jgi:hypothetical protein
MDSVGGGGKSNALQLMLCDLKDAIATLDNDIGICGNSRTSSTSSSLVGDGGMAVAQTLQGMTQPIDRLAKHVRSCSKVAPGVQKEIDGVLQSMKRTLMRIVNDVNSSSGRSLSSSNSNAMMVHPDAARLACRHLLRVNISVIAQSATSTLNADIARVVMRASKALYLIDAAPGRSADSVGEDGGGSDDGNSNSNNIRSRGGTTRRSISGSSSSAEEQMLQGGGDLLLELLQQTWTRLPSDLYRELQAAKGSSGGATMTGRGANVKDGSVNDEGLPSHLDDPLFLLLEAAVYASGIVRVYASSAVNAKRLVHLGVVDCLVTGMRVTASSMGIIDKAYQKGELPAGTLSAVGKAGVSSSSSSPHLIALIASQLGRAMEQTTGSVRALTLEKVGRAKLLEQGGISLLCRLMVTTSNSGNGSGSSSRSSSGGNVGGAYDPSPELVLNCVRATAKLSLLEPFRAQLNQKPITLSQISALIAKEETAAAAAERGICGEETWPQWHTWPLLSRVCFTLANLTTSNDTNRHTIALSCNAMTPLLRLLGRCGLRLRRLAQERRRRKAEILLDQSFDSDAGSSFDLGADGGGMSSPSPYGDAAVVDDEESTGGDGDVEEEQSSASRQRAAAAAAAAASSKDAQHEAELGDAAVKMLRLVANLAIEAKVGAAVATDLTALNVAVSLLGDHLQGSGGGGMHGGESSGDGAALASEELLLNAVAACTNISYYACINVDKYAGITLSEQEESKVGGESDEGADEFSYLPNPNPDSDDDRTALVSLCRMASLLASCLFHVNDEVVLEAARALGNLTRLPQVLQGLTLRRTDEALILLLGHRSMDVVAAVAGTLVNLSAHAGARANLWRNPAAVDALTQALRRSSLRHMTTSMLVCQVFHNMLSTPAASSASSSSAAEAMVEAMETGCEELLDTLDELVDLAVEMQDEGREDAAGAGQGGNGYDKYAAFARVGGAVRELLLQQLTAAEEAEEKEVARAGPSRGREEKGV